MFSLSLDCQTSQKRDIPDIGVHVFFLISTEKALKLNAQRIRALSHLAYLALLYLLENGIHRFSV